MNHDWRDDLDEIGRRYLTLDRMIMMEHSGEWIPEEWIQFEFQPAEAMR